MRFPLPTMQCDDDCGECCGVILCKPHEYDAVVKYASENGISPVRQGLGCPWYQGGKCSVYPVRPWICRTYGHFANRHMTCPRGYNVNVSPMIEKMLAKEYMRTKLTRCLHEVLPDWQSVLGDSP